MFRFLIELLKNVFSDNSIPHLCGSVFFRKFKSKLLIVEVGLK